MPKLSMDDMASAPPSNGSQAQLELQKAKQERLMMKEKRLAKTEERLMSQHELARQRQEHALRAREQQAAEDFDISVAIAMHTACEEVGFDIAPKHREFIEAFMRQLRKDKVI